MRKRKETLRSHRTRDAILDVMASHGQPISPTRLAEITGASLGSAAYHVRTLASAGVIRLADEQRGTRGAIEHFYELVSPEDADVVDALDLFLRAARALALKSDGGYPALTVLDQKGREQLTKELKRVAPRVHRIAEGANRRAEAANKRAARQASRGGSRGARPT